MNCADAVISMAQPDDIIWIHDYQLMLVPSMIREVLPDVRIGYFQHIPFPDFEIFRSLPWKTELIEGILGADIIGFQTDEDVRYFIRTIEKVLGKPCTEDGLTIGNRSVAVKSFPISIDYGKFRTLATHENTLLNVSRIKSIIHTKIALSVDRLDYSKGIIQRLKAFDLFLSRYKNWHQKVTLIHIIVPSRDTVSSYKELKTEMDQLVSCINGKYASLGWQPIHHYYQSFDPYMLSAFYQCADLAIVTPLRDGMNLVSKEYIACNINKNGVLLLGEAAGAANELHDALLLNPNNSDEFARKIYEGLNISTEEKQKRMSRMQQVIADADIFKWADSFISKLLSIVTDRSKKTKKNTVTLPLTTPTPNNMAV
ncbi:MAG: trehalose-6-phosphate synthase [Chitinophagaceae bacterium]